MKTLLLIAALLLNLSVFASEGETVAVGGKLPCGATKASSDRTPGKMIDDESSNSSIKSEKPSGIRQ